MKKALTTATLVCSLGLNGAFAGTMGEETYSFDGLYIGAGAGLASIFITSTASNASSDLGVSASSKVHDSTAGILFEGQVGYGKMFNENAYLGIKGSVYYTPINYTAVNSEPLLTPIDVTTANQRTQMRFDPVYNISGVLGFEVLPHFLPYVQAGVSFAGLNVAETQSNAIVSLPSSLSTFRTGLSANGYKTGYNVGIGTAYQMDKNWAISGELVYNDLGKYSARKTVNTDNRLGNYTSAYTWKLSQVSLFANISYLIPGT